MDMSESRASKVPEVTVTFWALKILATTLGETGGDAVSMSMQLGYLVATAIFALVFGVLVTLQVKAGRFNAALYWATIVATTTVGTTLADFADRSLGIGYAGGTSLLLALLAASLLVWYRNTGSIGVESVQSPKSEAFYWITILFSQTLGTALGYRGAALVFGVTLCVVAAGYFWTNVSRTALFWMAFVITRPLGAVVGDFLDKPLQDGGLALSRYAASTILLILIVLGLVLFPQKPAAPPH